MVCDGKEVLHTTYTLRYYSADHRERWTTIVTNQNTFWRIEEDDNENAIETMTTVRIIIILFKTHTNLSFK